jgi:uncharacterized membrane protein YjjP (DUF1212 family)
MANDLQPVLDAEARLDLVVQAGELLLENGAATYRVEETMTTLGHALGLPEIAIFATPTGFMLQAAGPTHALTRVRRVSRMGVNMNRLVSVNRLSRDAARGEHTPESVAVRLAAIRAQKPIYPTWLVVGGVAVACGAFALLLGGGWREFAAAVLGALVGMLFRVWLRGSKLVPLLVTIVAAFGATAASTLGCHALRCPSPDLAPIAAVLQLVPGVPLVTSVIDLATGDILSGLTRGAYAVLMAIGIALGMLLVLAWGVR